MRILGTFFVLLAASTGSAWANPFLSGRPSELGVSSPEGVVGLPFLQTVRLWQQQLHRALTESVMALKDGSSDAMLWSLLLLGFGYGVFHVLAPGHGKIIVGSWFLGNGGRKWDGVWAGLMMAAGHTITAVLVVGVLSLIFGLSHFSVLERARYVELAGYGAIALIGLWLLARCFQTYPVGCTCGPQHHHDAPLMKNRRALSLFAATSLVPCTGSMIILLFTLANGVVWAGILAVGAIALGMWITVTLLGTASLLLRRVLARDGAEPSPWRHRVLQGLRILAAMVVTATGGLLFASTLYGMGA